VIIWQIWFQWQIISEEYAIPSKDTYVWLGQSWYLLEEGYLLREHMPLHYPKGFTFFLAAPELIYPDWRFAYFYMKFAGIPFFTFYILVIFIILRKIFQQDYLVFLGLFLTLISNFLFSRFIGFVSSSIPTLLILISLIIINSRAPFYILGFFISSIFLFNAIFGFFYIIVLAVMLLAKFLSYNNAYNKFMIDYICKTTIITSFLLISYLIHTIIVKNVSILDILIAYLVEFGYPETNLSQNIISIKSDYLLQFRYILRDIFPYNDFISQFLDIEKKVLSYYFLFTLMSLFLATKKFKKEIRDIINFGKISVLLIIAFYVAEIIFKDMSVNKK
jgi:hypothetical protein